MNKLGLKGEFDNAKDVKWTKERSIYNDYLKEKKDTWRLYLKKTWFGLGKEK